MLHNVLEQSSCSIQWSLTPKFTASLFYVNIMFGNKARAVVHGMSHQNLHPSCRCFERRVPADAMVVVWLEAKLI